MVWKEHIFKYNNILYYRCLEPFNPKGIPKSVESLVCPPHCGKEVDMPKLSFVEYHNLQSIHISSFSFPYVQFVEVKGLEQLKEFVAEDHCFFHESVLVVTPICSIEDCPLLETITIGYFSFIHFQLSVKSHRKGTE